MSTCAITGTLVDITETAISGATVRAYAVSSFVSGSNYITNGVVSTTTATDGTWTLNLTRTAALSPARTITIEFEYTNGTGGLVKEQYAVTVPNSASATFVSLISLP